MLHLETDGVRVEHVKSNDRFAHRILIRCEDRWLPVLESVEGTAADAWPQSPPWQQIVQESVGPNGEDVLLGVGLSGNGHWSIAIDRKHVNGSEGSTSESRLGLHFDNACKISKGADFLGSTWQCCEGWAIATWTPGQVFVHNTSSADSTALQLDANHGFFHYSGSPPNGVLVLTPSDSPMLVKTHRWAFVVSRIANYVKICSHAAIEKRERPEVRPIEPCFLG
ncbi:MAG: hypothetical protein ACK56W_16030 [Pirellula sp.]|jgi:hypothetical protein|nr:hypothetical protein [Pirellula sp.]